MHGPIIKWVGGKGRLLSQIVPLLPTDLESRVYYEPFFGGGALFFHLHPRYAIISDINPNLVTLYQQIRDDVEGVIVQLESLAKAHSKTAYYEVRERYNTAELSPNERAASFIYLNKTCFNGLHRVNKRGHFNTPMGDYKNPTILDPQALRHASERLKDALGIFCNSFDTVATDIVESPKFVYFDPPYIPVSATSNFTGYATDGFTDIHQVALRDTCVELTRQGHKFMLSNSDAPRVHELYKDFYISTVQAPRSINSKGSGRACVSEVVVRNYKE